VKGGVVKGGRGEGVRWVITMDSRKSDCPKVPQKHTLTSKVVPKV
jgi:hypothetical protein